MIIGQPLQKMKIGVMIVFCLFSKSRKVLGGKEKVILKSIPCFVSF